MNRIYEYYNLYYLRKCDRLVILMVYVDNLISSNDTTIINKCKETLNFCFQMSFLEPLSFYDGA